MNEAREFEITTKNGHVFAIFAADSNDAWDEAAAVLEAEENGDIVWQVKLIKSQSQ